MFEILHDPEVWTFNRNATEKGIGYGNSRINC